MKTIDDELILTMIKGALKTMLDENAGFLPYFKASEIQEVIKSEHGIEIPLNDLHHILRKKLNKKKVSCRYNPPINPLLAKYPNDPIDYNIKYRVWK